MILRILPIYYFSLECLFLYFLLCLFYSSTNQLPPILGFLNIVVVGNICLYFILKQKQLSLFIPFLAGIFAGGIGYFLGLNQISALVCASFIFFRMKAFSTDHSLWLEERDKFQILFYCSGFIFFFIGWIVNYSYMNLLYGICIGFTIFFSFGRFLQHAVNKNTIKNVQGLIGTLSIAAILAGLITIFLPIGKWGVVKLLEGLVNLVGFFAAPVFKLTEKIVIKPKPKEPEEELRQNLDKIPQTHTINKILQEVPSWTWFIIFILILIVIGIFLRKFKYINVENKFQQTPLEIEQISIKENTKMKRRFFKQSAPSEQIRKLIFQLQKFALKHNQGRLEHETINEWFGRAQFQQHQDLLHAYEQVRYGNGQLEHNEKHYENEFQKLKKEIKNRDREENKE